MRLLKVMHRSIHPLLGQRWETTMPVLLEYLDGESSKTEEPISHPPPHLYPVYHKGRLVQTGVL